MDKTTARTIPRGLGKAVACDESNALFAAAAAGDGLVDEFVEDGLVEDAGDGLVEDAGDPRHAQYGEDELPLFSSALAAFTPPEGQLVPSLA